MSKYSIFLKVKANRILNFLPLWGSHVEVIDKLKKMKNTKDGQRENEKANENLMTLSNNGKKMVVL